MDFDNKVEETAEHIHGNKKAYPSVGQAFALIGVYVLITVAVALPIELIKRLVDPAYTSLLNVLTYALSMFLLLFFGIRMRKSIKFSWKWVSLPILLLSIPLILSLSVLMEPLVDLIPMPQLIKDYFNSIIINDIYSFLMIAILAPFIEELIFRGIVLNGFLKRYSPTKAIILSALIFGVAHLNPWQFPGAFILGLIMGWLYWKTNSLIPGMVLHFLNNSLSFLMMMMTHDNFITTQQLMGGGKAYYILYGMCVPIFVGSVFLIQLRLKMREG